MYVELPPKPGIAHPKSLVIESELLLIFIVWRVLFGTTFQLLFLISNRCYLSWGCLILWRVRHLACYDRCFLAKILNYNFISFFDDIDFLIKHFDWCLLKLCSNHNSFWVFPQKSNYNYSSLLSPEVRNLKVSLILIKSNSQSKAVLDLSLISKKLNENVILTLI